MADLPKALVCFENLPREVVRAVKREPDQLKKITILSEYYDRVLLSDRRHQASSLAHAAANPVAGVIRSQSASEDTPLLAGTSTPADDDAGTFEKAVREHPALQNPIGIADDLQPDGDPQSASPNSQAPLSTDSRRGFEIPPGLTPNTQPASDGRLAARQLVVDSDLGLDFRPADARPAAELPGLITDRHQVVTRRRDGRTDIARNPAPWAAEDASPDPLFIAAAGGFQGLHVPVGDEQTVQFFDPARFAEALAQELRAAEVSPERPLVLLVPYGGIGSLRLPRMIASRTNRVTWSFSGPLAIESDVSGNGFITTVAAQGRPEGTWIRSTPDIAPAGTDDVVVSEDGHRIPETAIWSFPIPGSDHRSVGHAIHTPSDQSTREKEQALFEERAWFNDYDDETFEWFGQNAYFYSGHGAKDSTFLTTNQGVVSVGASEFAHYLKRRPSLSALPQESPIVLVSCFTGAPGSTVAQTVANVTGRRTYAPTAEAFESLAVMPSSEDGTDGQFVRFDPQPASLKSQAPLSTDSRRGFEIPPGLTPNTQPAPGSVNRAEIAAVIGPSASTRGAIKDPQGYRERVALAKHVWEEPVPKAVARLERSLLDAGFGARSLVIGEVPGKSEKWTLWAVNFEGTVRWQDNRGEKAQAPQSATGPIMSIDLDPRARVINPAPELLAAGEHAGRFCELAPGADLKHVM